MTKKQMVELCTNRY